MLQKVLDPKNEERTYLDLSEKTLSSKAYTVGPTGRSAGGPTGNSILSEGSRASKKRVLRDVPRAGSSGEVRSALTILLHNGPDTGRRRRRMEGVTAAEAGSSAAG